MDRERVLISTSTFRTMARKGARAKDFDGMAVLKHGFVQKAADAAAGEREVSFILSNANVDREGDSIAVSGWELGSYRRNPIALWAHDHSQLPVAKATKVWVEGRNLQAIDQFVTRDIYEFADTVYRMLKAGFLNACSVGFQPMEWDAGDSGGVKFLRQELLEHSVCPVPAHPEALVIARSKGIDTRPLHTWAERALDSFNASGDAADAIRRDIARLRAQADPVGRVQTARRSTSSPLPRLTRAVEQLKAHAGLSPDSVRDLRQAATLVEDVLAREGQAADEVLIDGAPITGEDGDMARALRRLTAKELTDAIDQVVCRELRRAIGLLD